MAGLGRRVSARLREVGRLSNYDRGWVDRVAAKVRLPLDRWYNERIVGDVRRLGEAVQDGRDPDGPHVMIVSLRVWQGHALTEAMLANALRERGCRVSILTCGGGLPVCEVGWARKAWPRPCDRCAHFTDAVATTTGFPHYRLADHLPWGGDSRDAPASHEELAGGAPTEYEESGAQTAAWLLKTTSPETVPEGPELLRDSAVTAAGVEQAANRIIDIARPDVMFMVNGIFVEENVLARVSRARGVRAVTYGYGMHENTMVMSSDPRPALHFENESLWEEARATPLADDERERLDRYLREREHGAGTPEFLAKADRDPESLKRQLGLDPGRRLLVMFTNITWDSACLNRDVAFPGATEWIQHAVRTVAGREDCQLVVRVHPAEATLGTRESAEVAVAGALPVLPANVRVVPAREQINSYALANASDEVFVYSSTTGLESALRGKPVVVAGDVHYRGRGFTVDLETPEDMTRVIAEGVEPLSPEQLELAHRYAYAFFFRLLTPIPQVVRQTSYSFAEVTGEQISLAPGADPYLDLICDRILDGRPLSTPPELVQYPSPYWRFPL